MNFKKIISFGILTVSTLSYGGQTSFDLFVPISESTNINEHQEDILKKEVKSKNIPMFSIVGIFEESCLSGNGRSCLNISNLYATDQGGEQNIIKSIEYKKKACDLGIKQACSIS